MKINLISDNNGTEINFHIHQVAPEYTRYVTEDGWIEGDSTIHYSSDRYNESVYTGMLKVDEGKNILEAIYIAIDETLAFKGVEGLEALGIIVNGDHPRSMLVGDVIEVAGDGFGWQKVRVAEFGFKTV